MLILCIMGKIESRADACIPAKLNLSASRLKGVHAELTTPAYSCVESAHTRYHI